MNPFCSSRDVIEKNFSRHANLYDKYAGVQCMAAYELIKKSPAGGLRYILDVGCGTGNYTLLLRHKFKASEIKALDISCGMVDIARRKCDKKRIEFIVADAEKFDLHDRFDLITSNATFQWFNNLGLSLIRYKDALTRKGHILFSIFGPLTFLELSWSLKEVLGEEAVIASESFPGKEELTGMMESCFRESTVKETIIKRRYNSLAELLYHIKYTGTRGNRINGISLWRRAVLDRIEEAYMSNFGCIEASYQIFYCKASR